MSHGDWPLYPPADGEAWELYEAISAPLEYGVCPCEALCVCEDAA